MKNKVIAVIIIFLIFATPVTAEPTISFYKRLVKRESIAQVREYWNEDLTCEILQNRGDDIVVEKIIGACVDSKGNGKIMNPADPNYDYISYKRVKGAKKGDVILTVCIYTPGNSYTDDVCERFDYIIDREKGK